MRKRFTRLLDGLTKTRKAIASGIQDALGRSRRLDEDALAAIEETLIAADVGPETSARLVALLRDDARGSHDDCETRVAELLATEIERILSDAAAVDQPAQDERPLVAMIVGVNGVGKTTTIGKLANKLARDGKSVVLAAADTFRAAAGEQLSIWAARSRAQYVGGEHGGDPASVAYDALDAAIARSADVLIVDTAGRLHTRKNLLDELRKIKRVLSKRMPGAPHEVLLVLDANTGQNALSQARLFDEAVGVTSIALAKLDGTAKGGIVIAIASELSIPVRFVGTGEGVDDIEDFDPSGFARAIMGTS